MLGIFRHWIIFIILISVIFAVTWFWYDGKLPFFNKKSLNFKFLPADVDELTADGKELIKNIKQKSDATIKNIISTATEKPKEITANIVNDVKKSAAESFKNQLAEVFGLNASVNQSALKGIAIVRPISQGISLFIESEGDSVNYNINWGDGELSAGSLDAKQNKTLDHVWKNAGDYSITVEIEGIKDKQKKNFTFPVKILK